MYLLGHMYTFLAESFKKFYESVYKKLRYVVSFANSLRPTFCVLIEMSFDHIL